MQKVAFVVCILFSLLLSNTSLFAQNTELIPFRHKSRWGLSNQKGELVVPAIYDEVSFFGPREDRSRYFKVKEGESFGVLDANGKVFVRSHYDYVRLFCEDVFVVKNGHDQGLLTKNGRFLLDLANQDIEELDQDGLAIVRLIKKMMMLIF